MPKGPISLICAKCEVEKETYFHRLWGCSKCRMSIPHEHTLSMKQNPVFGIGASCRKPGRPSRHRKRRSSGGALASERLKITASAWAQSRPLCASSGTRAGAKMLPTPAFG
eukprot:9465216-Pyramimonas_sp.AAC.1